MRGLLAAWWRKLGWLRPSQRQAQICSIGIGGYASPIAPASSSAAS